MESPTLWLTLLLLPRGGHRSHPLALTILTLYLLHYIHRTLIYPLHLAIKSKSKTGFALVIALVAFSFNLLNAYLQARSASHYAEYLAAAFAFRLWVWLRVLVGRDGDLLLGDVGEHTVGSGAVEAQGGGGRVQDPAGWVVRMGELPQLHGGGGGVAGLGGGGLLSDGAGLLSLHFLQYGA